MSAPSPYRPTGYLLRTNEVALKGQNRGKFEELLIRNARKVLEQLSGPLPAETRLSRSHGRVLAYGIAPEVAAVAFARVFGVSGVNPLRIVETRTADIIEGALAELHAYVARAGVPATFRVETRRSEKEIPETSEQLNRALGSAALALYPSLKVSLKDPALTLGIEVRRGRSFIWTEQWSAPGGLPVGCNSPVLALLSGGLDSPVAAIRLLRRGCPVRFVHFSGEPFVGPEPLEKVEDLVRLVNRYQPAPQPLYVIPFGKIQEEVALATNPKLRTLLYRRLMFRIAGRLAEANGLRALATGESVGQVASQTLDNLAVINRASPMVVLRPLLGMDKEEIIRDARRWGTYETSIRPGIDCCTLFADRHPALRASELLIADQEKRIDIESVIQRALASVEVRQAAPKGTARSGSAPKRTWSSPTSNPAPPPTS
jgi:thiamine biosynthesis protein ThiI